MRGPQPIEGYKSSKNQSVIFFAFSFTPFALNLFQSLYSLFYKQLDGWAFYVAFPILEQP